MATAAGLSMIKPGGGLLRSFASLLLLGVVMPVLMLAGLILWQGAVATRKQVNTQLAASAELNASDIDNFVQAHRAALQVLTESRNAAGNLDDHAAWTADLTRILRYYPAFAGLLVTDGEGWLRLTHPHAAGTPQRRSVADRDYFRGPRRTGLGQVSNAFRGYIVGPVVAVSAPLYAHGRFAGVVGGVIRVDQFAALRSRSLQAHGYEVLLLDATHTVVYASSGLPYRSLYTLRDAGRDQSLRALERSGSRARMQQLQGVLRGGGEAYGVVVPLKVGWQLLLLAPEQVVASELRRNTLALLGVLVLVLLGVLTIADLQLRRLGASVRGLLQNMERFALDTASTPVATEGLPSELSPLAEALNGLAARVGASHGEATQSLLEQERLRGELQAVARRLLTAQEDERHAISRELHDDIGQSITAIKLGAMAVQDDDNAARRGQILAEIITISDQTVTKLRDLSLLLRPPQLDLLGIEAALRGQAELLFRAGQPGLELALTGLPRRPDAEVELACFRIAQEALTNIVRHAHATHVTLTLAPGAQAEQIVLTVSDDGRGFEPGRDPGLGLATMRERAQQLGGTLEIETSSGHGTRVRATLPMQRPAH